MQNPKEIIDISLHIEEGATVYPGNPEVRVEEHAGATSVHSAISLGTHTGTHIDAPRHVFPEGVGIDEMDVSAFYGSCLVVDVTHATEAVMLSDIENLDIQEGARILFKTTNSQRGFDSFYDDYIYIDGDAADYLAEKNVALVGIDYFSVKKRGGSDNRPHTSLLEKNIAIIEGIDLSQVEAGEYVISAFPLKIKTGDGAPARVMLLKF